MAKSKKSKNIKQKSSAQKKVNMKKQSQTAGKKTSTNKASVKKKSPRTASQSAVKTSPKKTQSTSIKKSSSVRSNTNEMTKTKTNQADKLVTEKVKNTAPLKSMFNKQTIALLAIVAILGIAYVFRGVFIAAMVNGQPISRLKIVRETEKTQGRQVLDNYVMEALIEQKAKEKGIEISDEIVDAQIEEIKQSVTEQGQDFEQLMALQGLTMPELQRQIKMQQMIEVMVGAEIEVTDEAVAEYLENNKDFLPDDMEQAELEDLAKQQLQQQEMSQKYQEWVNSLKEEANIRYFVGYGGENELGL